MERDSIERASDALGDVLSKVDNDELQATAEQRAYLRGALDTLRMLAGE